MYKRRITSLLVLFLFLFNSISYAIPINPKPSGSLTQDLATASIFGGLKDREHKDMGNIGIGVLAHIFRYN